jgi:hypothetical protein
MSFPRAGKHKAKAEKLPRKLAPSGSVAKGKPAAGSARNVGPNGVRPRATAVSPYVCAEHVRQFGGESPLHNLMEVK